MVRQVLLILLLAVILTGCDFFKSLLEVDEDSCEYTNKKTSSGQNYRGSCEDSVDTSTPLQVYPVQRARR